METVNEELVEEAMDQIAPNDRQEDEDANANTEFSSDFPDLIMPENLQENDAFAFTESGGSSNTQTVIPNRLSDQEYYNLMQSLNIQQQMFVQHVTFLVKTNKLPFHIFLSGGAGVGKSHTIKAIFQSLVKFYNSIPGNNPDHEKIFIAAPTGRAAYNVHGNTVHSLFGIPPNKSLKKYQKLSYSKLNTLRMSLSEMVLLIIDEVSMVGSNMLNFLDQRLQEIFDSSDPFGNVSVLFVGDLFQLRPVGDKWIFYVPENPYGDLASSFWTDHVQMFELTRIMRQKNVDYAQMLNRIREAKHTQDDIQQLKARIVKDIHIQPTYPHLFTQNALVDQYNQTILGTLNTPTIISTAKDSVQGQVTKSKRSQLLQEVKEYPSQLAQNLVYSLMLKVSAQYMIIHNVDTSDGLTNGVPCILKSFECHPSGEPYLLWVQFEDKKIGEKLKGKLRHLYLSGINRNWVPILKITKQFDIKHESASVSREQFPVKPCFGMTIHKSQGATIPGVVISFKHCFAPHTVYVAVSRSTDINDVYIFDFKESQIKVDEDVVKEMNRLRQNPLLQLPLPPIHDDSSFIVMLNNSRSLHDHILSLKAYSVVSSAQVLVIQETFLKDGDADSDYEINDLTICHRIDISTTGNRRHGGSAILKQSDINYTRICSSKTNAIEMLFGKMQSFSILSVYKPPRMHINLLIDQLQGLANVYPTHLFEKFVLIGDINLDLLAPSQELDLFQNFVQKTFGLHPAINQETTNYHSCLDHIYSNFGIHNCEAYWSDHKIVWADLQL